MISLPNNCRRGEFAIYPKNYKSPKAPMDVDWRITYWFYDDNTGKRKQIVVKGMNRYKEWSARKSSFEDVLAHEEELLSQGFNPITRTLANIEERDVTEFTPLPEALDYAYKQLKCDKQTLASAKSSLKKIQKAITELHLNMPVKEVRLRHLVKILNKCTLSPASYNHYRAYLMMLFKVLLREDAVESNPVRDMEKQKGIKKAKEGFTLEERKKIAEHFKKTDIYYYRFLQCFFHSGARPLELLQLRKENINLKNLTFKILIKKGKLYEEQLRPIKKISVRFWEDQLKECKEGDYIFGYVLRPRKRKGTRDYVTKKWQREVKDKKGLGIDKNLYWLKHTNLTEIKNKLGINKAKEMAGHTSTQTTKIYMLDDLHEMDDIKKMDNEF